MPRFHISKDGNPRPCEASDGCPLGETSPHGDFRDQAEARKWAEEVVANQMGGSFSNETEQKPVKPKRVSSPRKAKTSIVEKVKETVTERPRVFGESLPNSTPADWDHEQSTSEVASELWDAQNALDRGGKVSGNFSEMLKKPYGESLLRGMDVDSDYMKMKIPTHDVLRSIADSRLEEREAQRREVRKFPFFRKTKEPFTREDLERFAHEDRLTLSRDISPYVSECLGRNVKPEELASRLRTTGRSAVIDMRYLM